jgi:predicted transcriptional regulator
MRSTVGIANQSYGSIKMEQVIDFLTQNPESRPIDIAKATGRTRSEVNRILYALQTLNKVKKVSLKENGGDPRWSVTDAPSTTVTVE